MNSDARISVSFTGHAKTLKLKRRLGNDGLMSLITLWLYTAQNKPSGIFTNMDIEDIEIAAQWEGSPGNLVDTLVELRFIDLVGNVHIIHNWEKNNPWAFHADERSEQARKAAKARWGKKNKDADECNEQCCEDSEAMQRAEESIAPSPNPNPKESKDLSESGETGNFEIFWTGYPRKEKKKEAEKIFNRLTKVKQRLAIDDSSLRYEDTDRKFIPLPTSYLRGERWADEINEGSVLHLNELGVV